MPTTKENVPLSKMLHIPSSTILAIIPTLRGRSLRTHTLSEATLHYTVPPHFLIAVPPSNGKQGLNESLWYEPVIIDCPSYFYLSGSSMEGLEMIAYTYF